MARFQQHIRRAVDNLVTLRVLNEHNHTDCSWQATVCFYTALHFVHAHVVAKTAASPRSHVELAPYIDPDAMSAAALSAEAHSAYLQLFNLSQLARYLHDRRHDSNDKSTVKLGKLVRAVKHLDCIMQFVCDNHAEAKELVIADSPTRLWLNGKLCDCMYFTDKGQRMDVSAGNPRID